MRIFYFAFFFSVIYPQFHSSEWHSITSLLTPRNMEIANDGVIYASTSGGLLEFNPEKRVFDFIQTKEGLVYLDLNCITLDRFGRIWMGGSYPNGYLQVYDRNHGLLRKITHLGIMQIDKIVIEDDVAFAIYRGVTTSEIGILMFELDEDGLPEYKDYFSSFSDEHVITKIRDLDVFNNDLYVTTEFGVYSGDYTQNLKNTSNWTNYYDARSVDLFIANDNHYLSSGDSIFYQEGENWNNYNLILSGKAIDIMFENQLLHILTEAAYYEISEGEIQYSFMVPEMSHSTTKFTSFAEFNDIVYLGMEDAGLLLLDKNLNEYHIHVPNTPFKNEYHALTVTSQGYLAATSNKGILIFGGKNYQNLIPWQHTKHIPDWRNDPDNIKFIWTYLTYLAGEHIPMSIIEKNDGTLIFPNSGVEPMDDYWLTTGAVIELDIQSRTFQSFGKEDDVIDGMWGINNSNIFSEYMVINQINKDVDGNIWITNPYCERDSNILAIQIQDNSSWVHVKAPNEHSFRPTSIAFDRFNRTWLGFAYDHDGESTLYSEGGIKIFNKTNLSSDGWDDSTWVSISNPSELPGDDPQASVWSIAFDETDFLWILNEKGIRGYEAYDQDENSIILSPFRDANGNPREFLSHISYTKGNRIKVDSQNNKWVITHQGVWIIKHSLENDPFWPSAEGLHPENSGLLSDVVYDVAFDNDKGLAYLATDKGISILQIPFADNPTKKQDIYISPNPFIIPDDEFVLIKNVPSGSTIQIMTITGIMIKKIKLDSNISQVLWDGNDKDGRQVGTAVYLVAAHHPTEKNKVSKIAVIRK